MTHHSDTEISELLTRLEALDRASADAIDVADNIIAINCGIDTPKEWNRAIAKVVKARAALSTITPKEAE